ncbi:F-box and associated interaction domains-containing protein [Heracleum sosnowskyi]|uniref:F-box and associated interaction domains-containing protein n=1 Tax=Heracleum sosnowskyi TaxID=360622 RepID=A0AAD8HIX0_9APIA|nr:F-box and associated interaction domains-containing protein [Heracleum sosnowskyi]
MTATVYLAEEVIAQILDRLPVKTLLRFRCVSKPWCSLIDSPQFVKAQLKRSIECNTNTDLIISSGVSSYWLCADSLDDTTAVEIDKTLRNPLLGTTLVGSCNGLLCSYDPCSYIPKTDIFLWNLATRRCRKLPPAPTDFLRPTDFFRPSDRKSFHYGFGYDAVNDDYKILSISNPEVIIYSLRNNSWRRLQNISNGFQFIRCYGLFLGGALHWITINTLALESYQSILAFDLAAENYREVTMPKVRITYPYNELRLCNFGESLCVLEFHHKISIDIWLMNDYGVGNSWCKLFSLEHQEIINHLVCAACAFAFSKSRRDVLVRAYRNHVKWYNLETKEIKTVKINC